MPGSHSSRELQVTPSTFDLGPPYLFAFLRAVNLGKHNKVPMKQLIAALAAAGLPPAEYLLASGNLIFGANARATGRESGSATGRAKGTATGSATEATERPPRSLGSELERLIEKEFGVTTAVVFRTPDELQKIVDANPFDVPAGGSVHVSLWNVGERIARDARRQLADTDFGPDMIALVGDSAYMHFPATSHTSKLSNQVIERRLEVRATARNINTFERLLRRWPPVEERSS